MENHKLEAFGFIEEGIDHEEVSSFVDREIEHFIEKILKYVEDMDDFNDERIDEVQGYKDYLIYYLT